MVVGHNVMQRPRDRGHVSVGHVCAGLTVTSHAREHFFLVSTVPCRVARIRACRIGFMPALPGHGAGQLCDLP